MQLKTLKSHLLPLGIAILAASTGLCQSYNSTSSGAFSSDGEIPVTTKSDEARNEYLQGRALAEKLLANESLAHFDKAIALDPEFALAELSRANASPSAKEFFEHLRKAVSMADKVSDGERLLILANQAGANGDAAKQKDLLEKLAAEYPNDERAHFNLGGYYFGQNDFATASEHYQKATQIAPNYSPAWNILGYTYRQQGDYANAEQAFKKYIELIPNDPNPYDSYAELLLKMGRFEDSIVQYRKALSVDPRFMPSHFGISADLTYMGKPQDANAELQKIIEQARNDADTRLALFGMAVVAADSGKLDEAVRQMDKQFAIAEKKNDPAGMAADLQAKGNILLQAQKFVDAQKTFERLLQITDASNLSPEIKQNTQRFHHFNLTMVAVGKKDYGAAKMHAEEFRQGAEASKNPAQVRLAHELAGVIALAEKKYDNAIAELQQANLQNPRNLYRLYEAYQGRGDSKAEEYRSQVANFNPLPQLNYAFVRIKAQQKTEVSKKG